MVNFITLFTLLFTFNALACDPPVRVHEGDYADCAGWIVNDEDFTRVGNVKREIRLKDLKIAELETLNDLERSRLDVYKKELKQADDELVYMQVTTFLGYVVSFSAGAFVTGLIAKELVR